jgi:hypothetical protein
MNLYIETDSNGNPINHPAFEDNLLEAFGVIPEHWESFIRVERPILTPYQVFESEEPAYQKVNGVWTDVWTIRDMTDAEKTAQIEKLKSQPIFLNAVWDDAKLKWTLPPKPTDDKNYLFKFQTGTWEVVNTPKPNDGNNYYYNWDTNAWVVQPPPPPPQTP